MNVVFDDAHELITYLTELATDKNNVFRGYGKQSEMFPNLIRDTDWRNREVELLSEFEKYGLQYFSANNPIDFLSYAQHYGLPTRLLDFSYNPFAALSFALFMPKGSNYTCDNDKNYYYIRYCNLNEQICLKSLPYYGESQLFQVDSFTTKCSRMMSSLQRIVCGLEEECDENKIGENAILLYFKSIYSESNHTTQKIDPQKFKAFLDEVVEKLVNRKILFLDANQCSQRIVMQQGLFMFPYTLNKEEHKRIITKNTHEIMIHKDLRNYLLNYLDTIGMNTYRLMPDLQSVCQTVKRKIIDDRRDNSLLFKKTERIDGEQFVKSFLEKYGSMTLKELSAKSGKSTAYTQRILSNLVKKGMAEKTGTGKIVKYISTKK